MLGFCFISRVNGTNFGNLTHNDGDKNATTILNERKSYNGVKIKTLGSICKLDSNGYKQFFDLYSFEKFTMGQIPKRE